MYKRIVLLFFCLSLPFSAIGYGGGSGAGDLSDSPDSVDTSPDPAPDIIYRTNEAPSVYVANDPNNAMASLLVPNGFSDNSEVINDDLLKQSRTKIYGMESLASSAKQKSLRTIRRIQSILTTHDLGTYEFSCRGGGSGGSGRRCMNKINHNEEILANLDFEIQESDESLFYDIDNHILFVNPYLEAQDVSPENLLPLFSDSE